jgi:hypothetical protein
MGAVSGGHRNGSGELERILFVMRRIRDATGEATDGRRADRIAATNWGWRDVRAGGRCGRVLDKIDPTIAGWWRRSKTTYEAKVVVAVVLGGA